MQIAPALELPDTALTQHIAILGKTGSGKTYTAKSIVEQLLQLERRVVIIDPTGAWWGLRSSADGKAAGFPVIILGGQQADAPLPAHSGGACAQLVTDHAMQVVFDTSSMTVGERTRWFTECAGALFRLNRTPVHVVIDEAHMFAPQGGGASGKGDFDRNAMLHAANTLASGGRSRGVRLMMITQRPAKLHKDSLTCCDTLIAMKVIAPQDRDAIKEWVDGCGDRTKGKEILDSLAQLARGEGWVWYPEGGVLARAKFPKIRTFDSSATPEDGHEHRKPQTLASIDLAAVTSTLAAAAEEAKANDVGELKKRVKQLEQELATARRLPVQVVNPADIEKQIEAAVSRATLDLCDQARTEAASLQNTIDAMEVSLHNVKKRHEALLAIASRNTPVPQAGAIPAGESYAEPPVRAENGSNFGNGAVGSVRARDRGANTTRRLAENGSARGRGTATPPAPTAGKVNGTQQKILEAIASWHVSGFTPTRAMVALQAGLDPNGGHFSNSIGPLSTLGLIVYTADGIALTEDGEIQVGPFSPVFLSQYHNTILAIARKKSGASERLLEYIMRSGNRSIAAAALGAATNLDHNGGHFSNSIGPLSTLGLITRKDGRITPTSLLFPEGLR